MFAPLTRWLEKKRFERARARALKPLFRTEQLTQQGYLSQSGQDKWVIETLRPGKTDGVFVDVGAHDGVSFSNTFALEKLGWTGLAIEPIPEVFEKLARNRRCQLLRGCIGRPAGKRRFLRVSGYAEMLSGLVDAYDDRHKARIIRETAETQGATDEIEVDCCEFNEALAARGISRVDYLSIDVEGGEIDILQSIDFSRVDIRIIGVENNYADARAFNLLTRAGFSLNAVIGADEFYIRS